MRGNYFYFPRSTRLISNLIASEERDMLGQQSVEGFLSAARNLIDAVCGALSALIHEYDCRQNHNILPSFSHDLCTSRPCFALPRVVSLAVVVISLAASATRDGIRGARSSPCLGFARFLLFLV
jgi:hypothetical protein